MPGTSLAALLFGASRAQVLALLYLRPDESFHVREIARQIGASAGSLHRELRLLTDAGLLLREPVGNQVRYRANRRCPVFEELAGMLAKTVGIAEVLREALTPLLDRVSLAFVFGSIARDEASGSSDIDLLVVGTASFGEVVRALAGTHARLGREVNPVVMTPESLREKLGKEDPFLGRVLKDSKIWVTGHADDLAELIEDRPAAEPRAERI